MRGVRDYSHGTPRKNAEVCVTGVWQPMETAPKDGSMVLAWRDGWECPSWVCWILNPRTKTEFWNDLVELDHYDNIDNPPTHWIELPLYPRCA